MYYQPHDKKPKCIIHKLYFILLTYMQNGSRPYILPICTKHNDLQHLHHTVLQYMCQKQICFKIVHTFIVLPKYMGHLYAHEHIPHLK